MPSVCVKTFRSHSVFDFPSTMTERMQLPSFLAVILGITLLFSLLVTLASGAFTIDSNLMMENCESLDNTANWILDFLKECHGGTNGPLIVAGNMSERLIIKIQRSMEKTIALFTKPETSFDKAYASAKWTKQFDEKDFFRVQHKAMIFLVAAKSKPILRHVFKQLKSSRWWNFSGLFLILEEEPDKAGCGNAHSYLSTAWLDGLISTVYLCLQDDPPRLALYSYNPFEDRAPRPDWKTMAIYNEGRNGHPWTLLRQEVDLGRSVGSKFNDFSKKVNCDHVFFDRTMNLNGYPVRLGSVLISPTLILRTEGNTAGLNRFSGEDGWLAQTLWEKLNATIVDVPQIGNRGMGFTDDHGAEHGVKADVKSGRVDVGLNQRYVPLSKNLGTTYPHITSYCCFLTKSKGVIPLWEDLTKGISLPMGLLTVGTVMMAIPLLVHLEKFEYVKTTFSILRIMGSAPLVEIPRRFSAKFLVAGLLFVYQIQNAVLQGHISAIVTNPRTYKNIDTLNELKESNYSIHGYIAVKNIITDPELQRHFLVSEDTYEQCFKIAMDGGPVACAGDCLRLQAESANYSELHVSDEPIVNLYVNYITRIGWPIIGRMNQVIAMMISAGLTSYWRKWTLYRIERKSYSVIERIAASSSEPRPIRLKDIDFFVYVLLGSLLLSVLVFILEVAFFRWKNRRML